MKLFRFSTKKISMMPLLRVSTLFVAVSLIGGIGLTTESAARNLTVVSWGGSYQEAQRKAYFEPFMKKTGKKILDESYSGEMAKIKAMVEAKNVTWDVIQAETPEVLTACGQGLLEIIDWNRLGGKQIYMPAAIEGECGVGSNVFAYVQVYDADKIKGEGPNSWADFWNVKRWPGKRALRKIPKVNMEVALLADGVKPDDVYKVLSTEEGVKRAFKKLDELKPNLQWWEAGAQALQWLAAGEVVMTSTWHGRVKATNQEGHNFKIVWNGQCYGVDAWIIPKGSSNIDLAYEFIKFASDPKNQAVLASILPYGPTHVKAIAEVDPKVARELPNYPANLKGALAVNSEWWVEHWVELTERFNVWVAH